MKLIASVAAATLMVLCLTATALADVRLPDNLRPKANTNSSRTNNGNVSRMTIEARDGAEASRLQIPRTVLRQLRAELEGEDAMVAGSFGSGASPLQTIVAGVFLSLTVIFGGVWLLRMKRGATVRRVATLGVFVCALCASAATAVVLANIAPPRRTVYWPDTLSRAVQDGARLEGPVRVEIVDGGTDIKLIVPKASAEER